MEKNNTSLESIKKMIADGIVSQDVAEKYFPELKESEDEKIRREIQSVIEQLDKDSTICGKKYDYNQWLSWLEKQGEKKSIWHNEDEEPQRGRLILLIMQSGTPIVAKIIEPNHTFNHGERWAYIDDLLEKQGEQKTLCDKCKKEHPSHSCQDITALGRCAVEHEQKAANKVEPKFNVGDWGVDKDGNIFKIMRVNNDFNHITYACRPIEENSKDWASYSENDIRLWDITEDAKAGDVLCWDYSKCIALFKNIYDKESFNSYGFVGHCTGTFETRRSYHDIEGAHPATKEQRDVLFGKMREAGYEWDADRLELKKIEQKPAWSDKDKDMLNNIIDDYDDADEHNLVDDIGKVMWLKSIKERVACEANCTTTKQWKPSEEQIKVLEFFIPYVTKCSVVLQKSKDTLLSLLSDLKKLREE